MGIPADSLRGRIFQITQADLNRDKMCTLVKKWHSLIEAFVQAKTNDGYLVRLFAIAFTIRQKMQEIMINETQKSSLKDIFKKILSDTISKQITDECNKIFPLQNVLVHKAKVLKKPKFDLTKLMELYAENKDEGAAASEATTANKLEA